MTYVYKLLPRSLVGKEIFVQSRVRYFVRYSSSTIATFRVSITLINARFSAAREDKRSTSLSLSLSLSAARTHSLTHFG
jgi:hypothetical protein